MHARPVIGGVFIKLLSDRATWKKWSTGDRQPVGNWAPLPTPPRVEQIVADARTEPAIWSYTSPPTRRRPMDPPRLRRIPLAVRPRGVRHRGNPRCDRRYALV